MELCSLIVIRDAVFVAGITGVTGAVTWHGERVRTRGGTCSVTTHLHWQNYTLGLLSVPIKYTVSGPKTLYRCIPFRRTPQNLYRCIPLRRTPENLYR